MSDGEQPSGRSGKLAGSLKLGGSGKLTSGKGAARWTRTHDRRASEPVLGSPRTPAGVLDRVTGGEEPHI